MIEKIKELRELTSAGVKECKKALEEAEGDLDKALKILKERGVQISQKKKGRQTKEGVIDAYVHFGRNLGALVEINCETDFVARTEVFRNFAKDIAMQVAAANPKYLTKEEIPQEVLEKVEDKDVFVRENCLLSQIFVKDTSKTVEDYLKEVISQTKENIVIKRFVRFSLGE
ncbi:MAG: elongation factor Ts [Candidatus Omnitrophota bacterium]|nr:MAG: elongation factor Ts [Candidatus Omnitrophota bacterium]